MWPGIFSVALNTSIAAICNSRVECQLNLMFQEKSVNGACS
jgi:hypothetical protein